MPRTTTAKLRLSGAQITRESDGAELLVCAVMDESATRVIDVRIIDRESIDVCDNCGGIVVDGQERPGGVYCDDCTD